MIEEKEVEQGPRGAESIRATVVYKCRDRTYAVTLDLTHVPVMFFDSERRDEAWGGTRGVKVLASPEQFEPLVGGAVLEGPSETDEPASSGDCFCFEDDMGNRYCVCGIR